VTILPKSRAARGSGVSQILQTSGQPPCRGADACTSSHSTHSPRFDAFPNYDTRLDVSFLFSVPCDPNGTPPMTINELPTRIRRVLQEHARLETAITTLSETSDLYQAGMTSHASVNVMLALEGEFEVEFPDHMLRRNIFNSIGSIKAALEELLAA